MMYIESLLLIQSLCQTCQSGSHYILCHYSVLLWVGTSQFHIGYRCCSVGLRLRLTTSQGHRGYKQLNLVRGYRTQPSTAGTLMHRQLVVKPRRSLGCRLYNLRHSLILRCRSQLDIGYTNLNRSNQYYRYKQLRL